ncbi:MAG: DUF1638 domain-containing protein [Deltaproteobacteria bacterium]|nr:DUF1638 domain-containing protein [Deltaproteobacteria bacterium]
MSQIALLMWVVCLYGECFPGIDEFCERRGIIRAPVLYCYEMLLGSEQFHGIMDETAGTYFLERELIVKFDEYCVEPLELYDGEMRKVQDQGYFLRHDRKDQGDRGLQDRRQSASLQHYREYQTQGDLREWVG